MKQGIDQSTKRKRVTPRRRGLGPLACASCSVLLLLLAGCQRNTDFTTGDAAFVSPLQPADITYEELAERYNSAIEPIRTLWSRAEIEIVWAEIDEDGDRRVRSESGDGKFIMKRQGAWIDTAMTVEKLGKIYLWAGSNEDSYYLFDRVDGDDQKLYLGERGGIGQGRGFPLPVHPSTVPILLGLEPLPTDSPAINATIDLYQEQYLLNLPALGWRLLIDPVTFRPTRVDLLDNKGYSVLIAKLTGRLTVQDTGKGEGLQPMICRRAEVFLSGYESRFTLDFESATVSGVKDQMFDLDALKKALKPDRIIDLDQ